MLLHQKDQSAIAVSEQNGKAGGAYSNHCALKGLRSGLLSKDDL
jgi:hypothetical protein